MPQPQYELNIRDYWQIIQNRRFIFLIVFFAVFSLAVIRTNMQKPIYRASASVQLIERKTLGSMLTELVVSPIGDPLATQSRIITSFPILKEVVVELELAGRDATPTAIIKEAQKLNGIVSTKVIRDTSIITISVIYDDPVMAANIANQVAKVYIAGNLKEKAKESRIVREFIEKQLEEVSVKLKSTEEALTRFKETEAPSGEAVVLGNKLADLEETRQDILKRYTAAHPDVKSIQGQISRLKERMKVLPKKELEYSRLKRETDINAGLYLNLKDKLAGARITEAQKVEDVILVDTAIPSTLPIQPKKSVNYILGLVMGLVLGVVTISVVDQLDTSIGTIEDVESYLKLPIWGVIPFSPLGKEKGLTRYSTKQEVELHKIKKRLIINSSLSASVIEAYHILDTNIYLSFGEKTGPEVIIVSSSIPEEGKTLISTNLAITMAQRGLRVILVDADLRRPVVYRLFNLHREPGLSDILSNTTKLKYALRGFADFFLGLKDDDLNTTRLNNLQVLTPGHLPDNPTALLNSKSLNTLIDELVKSFDVVIFDLPPTLPVSDVSFFCPKADAVLLVYNVGKTPRAVLQRAKKQLESSGAKLKGVVLNCLNPGIKMAQSYYGYRNYQYYREKEGRKDV